MMYYIDLRKFKQKENHRIKQLIKSNFRSINGIAEEQNVPLDKQMWRLFFRNPQLTSLCICYDRWYDRVRDFAIYAVTHGIQIGIIDLTLDTTLKFKPIANLPRNQFANKQLLNEAYIEIWNEPIRTLDRHAKRNRRPYLLKAMRDDNLAHFRQQQEEQQFTAQLREIAKIGDAVDIKQVERVLPAYAFAYELDDEIRQMKPRQREIIYSKLPHFDGPFQFANECLIHRNEFIERLASRVWNRIPKNPCSSREHLINFARTWAARYDLEYPMTNDQAIYTACELLYYMQSEIEPSRPLNFEDLVSYESLHLDNDEEVSLSHM